MTKQTNPEALPSFKLEQEVDNITSFIKSVFEKTDKSMAVVGLSGGIDSATCLSLTVKALGVSRVLVYTLPSLQSATVDTDDVHRLCEFLEIGPTQVKEINISALQATYLQTLKLYTDDAHLSDGRIGNIAARIRMTILMDQANLHDGLVVGTENKSEHLLGYFTRFGDEASDLEPLRHLYKTQVFALAAHLGVPQEIIKKAPSANLWEDQTDEVELGFSYEQADPVLWQMADKGKSKEEIIKLGYEKELVEKVIGVVRSNSFKHIVPHKL